MGRDTLKPETKALLERMERCSLLLYRWDEPKILDCIKKIWDLTNTPQPKEIIVCKDIFDKRFARAIARARASARAIAIASASASAIAIASASAIAIAIDYDFDWFCGEVELGKEGNKKYIEIMEILLQAKEAGLGYLVDDPNTTILYIAQNPIVRIENNNFHSDTFPSIEFTTWSGYYLNGVSFPQDLWEKVVSKKMPFKDILAIEDVDQRRQAMKYGSWDDFVEYCGAKKIDEYSKMDINANPVHYELWEFPFQKNEDKRVFTKTVHFARYDCPSTRDKMVKGVPDVKTVAEAMAWGMSTDENILSPFDWMRLVPLLNES